MPAYLLYAIKEVSDPDGMSEYAAGAAKTLSAYGGKILAAAATPAGVEGSPTLPSVTLIEFPDSDSLDRWYSSSEYGHWKPIRQRASRSDAISF